MFETIILILLIMFILIYKLKYKSIIVAIEAFNNKIYLVNDLPDSQIAANLLAKIMIIVDKLVTKIIIGYDSGLSNSISRDKEYINYIRIIKKKLPFVKISENPINSQYTSYSINKGEELVFCIRSKSNNQIHDINELMYVAVHEISHIGCPETGHTRLFAKINLFLLQKAVQMGLYHYRDYASNPVEYCGMILTTSILG